MRLVFHAALKMSNLQPVSLLLCYVGMQSKNVGYKIFVNATFDLILQKYALFVDKGNNLHFIVLEEGRGLGFFIIQI